MPTQELLVTLLGTLIGVFAAFRLDRAWERRQSKQQYGQYLDSCRYDLGNLRAICRRIKEQVSVGNTNMMQIEAPALEALLTNPILHEHGPHGLIVALRSLSGFINTISNIMNHYRLASAFGRPLTQQGVNDTQNRMNQLVRVIEYIQGLIDAELDRLRLGVVRTKEDNEILDGLTKVLRNETDN
jgi:uncharacterized membrane protein YccC